MAPDKNPFEGKIVRFVEDKNDPANADGVCGHLEIIGDSNTERSFYDRYIKRFLDVFISFWGLVILSPVFAVISVAILIDDPGPLFFTQKRLGLNKRYFPLHKFRSMKMSTPHDVPTHMLENPEQYITRVGKFIRAHSLDELPQIWDIFIGNMSIIGPRPGLWNQDVLTAERDKYGANDVKPGLTGWAQINGRDELELEEKARLDGEYVNKESFLFDAKCFLGTLPKVAKDESVVEGGTGVMEKEADKKSTSTELSGPRIGGCNETIDWEKEKKVLIAGKDSYIGEALKKYLNSFDNLTAECFDTMTDAWKEMDFSSYDTVVNVAGIAHIKETDENRGLYYQVNRDLAVAIAEKAKAEGVSHYVYLSSMSVYGTSIGRIGRYTEINPNSAYGISKWEAEKLLWNMRDGSFTVSTVRPPMVYGKGCKGNYQLLRKIAMTFKCFPRYDNQRSMIFIDNLVSAIRGIIMNEENGVFFPQDVDYVSTKELVHQILKQNGKKMAEIPFGKGMVKLAVKKVSAAQKAFGDLTYEEDLNVPESWLAVKTLEEAIKLTEK